MNYVLILKEKINNNIEFNYNDKYSYGIIVPAGGKLEKVVLSITKKQVVYLESLSLYDYQKITKKPDN